MHQGSGFSHHARSAQSCASTFFGGGAPSSHPHGGNFAHIIKLIQLLGQAEQVLTFMDTEVQMVALV
jgi:hypothetical protein